jgi:hypothetical protein
VSRRLARINAEHQRLARREYWDRDPDHPERWTSYQTDTVLTTAALLERAVPALGVELVLVFPKGDASKP